MFCSMECSKKDFCGAWCNVNSECMLTNFLISPQDGPDTGTIDCYSNRRPGNLILKATATERKALQGRGAAHLTRGIYNFDWRTTASIVDSDPFAYMFFELDEETLVRTIQLHLGDNPIYFPSDQTEIRIGTTMPGPTDFSQLELVGTFDNPQAFEMRVFEVNPPKKVKFLAILEKDQTYLGLTFVEMFS